MRLLRLYIKGNFVVPDNLIARDFPLNKTITTPTPPNMRNFITSAAIFAATVSAIPVWQQCGGQDWTGSGSCESGSSCVKLNDCKLTSCRE